MVRLHCSSSHLLGPSFDLAYGLVFFGLGAPFADPTHPYLLECWAVYLRERNHHLYPWLGDVLPTARLLAPHRNGAGTGLGFVALVIATFLCSIRFF